LSSAHTKGQAGQTGWIPILAAGALMGIGLMAAPCDAQTSNAPAPPVTAPSSSPNQVSQSLGGVTGVQSTGINQAISPSTPTPSTAQPRNPSAVPGTPGVGRGLPGLPGGPPVNAPMGARDPSAAYMSPRILGSLACDLIFDPECL
jgi:hypothetical protein